ncbi:hypothetical protein CP02DC23_1062B, partial [Chlamydia psittaci 02DC23]
RGGVVL